MHDARGKEIAKTQARIDAVKRVHEQRAQRKDAIVQRRINDLLGEPDELSWTSDSLDRKIRLRIGNQAFNRRMENSESQKMPDRSYSPGIAGPRVAPAPAVPIAPRSPAFAPAAPKAPATSTKPAIAPATPPTIRRIKPTEDSPFALRSDNGRTLTLNEIFQLARNAANAFTESKALEGLEKSRSVVSQSDLRKLTREKQQLAIQTQLYRQQIAAMQNRLTSEAEFAIELLENVMDNLKVQELRYRNGETGRDVLLEAQRSKLNAKKRAVDAQNLLERFLEAIEELEEVELDFGDEEIHDTEIEEESSDEELSAEEELADEGPEDSRRETDEQEETSNDSEE